MMSTLQRLASLSPRDESASAASREAVAFLGWPVQAAVLERAFEGVAIAVLGLGVGALAVTPPRFWPAVAAVVAIGTGVPLAGPAAVRLLATARRTSALGAAPALVARAVLRMRLSPSPETAAEFAADTGSGRLARSLQAHLRRADATAATGIESFGRAWSSTFPALARSLSHLVAAGNVPAANRDETLDRALDAVLDGTRTATAEYAAAIRTPATSLYAFGVLLPLSLVALLPAASAAGVPVSMPVIAIGYVLVLPGATCAASAWLLARRPVAFPAPAVSKTHPDVPTTPWRAAVAGVLGGTGAALVAVLAFPPWTVPMAGLGCGVGAFLRVRFRPAMAVRRRAREVESGLADALALVGRRLQRGQSVEVAIDGVADDLTGATASLFATTGRLQRRLGLGVRAAFLGSHGSLADVPSPRTRSVAELLALATDAGRPAGEPLVSMASHLRDLQRVETESRRALAQVTRTLSNTAAVFAPLVGGATVSLADAIGRIELVTGATVPPTDALGPAVGAYVLLMAVVLSALTAGLERGFDRTLVAYRTGGALLSASVVFLASLHAVETFV